MMSSTLHPVYLSEPDLLAQCRMTFTRASGPGGQNRNKVETAVVIEHLATGIVASASERRTQLENRCNALFRLRCKLAVEVRSAVETAEEDTIESARGIPSELWNTYCRDGRIQISDQNVAFPIMLCEALDAIQSSNWELSRAAELLSTTSSQLIKLLKQHPPAFSKLNSERRSRGLNQLS